MPPPSSFLITGIFSLSGGYRHTDTRYYTTYYSAIDFLDPDNLLDVSIRKFTPVNEDLFDEGTLVYMVAKAALPVEEALLDAIYCVPLPPFVDPPGVLHIDTRHEGDPSDAPSEGDGPEDCAEDDSPQSPTQSATHVAFVVGTTTSVAGGTTRSFTLSVSEYVRDERRPFQVRVEFDGNSLRWKKTPLPSIGSSVVVSGAFKGFFEGGCVLDLLDISFGTFESTTASPSPKIRRIGHSATRRTPSTPTNRQPPSSPLSTPQPPVEATDAVAGPSHTPVAPFPPPAVPKTPSKSLTSRTAASKRSTTGKASSKRPNEEVEGIEEDSPAPAAKRSRSQRSKNKEAVAN